MTLSEPSPSLEGLLQHSRWLAQLARRLVADPARGHELWLKMFSRASVLFLRSVYTGNEDKGGDFVSWRLAHADDDPVQTIDEYINSWMERDFLRGELVQMDGRRANHPRSGRGNSRVRARSAQSRG